MSKLFITIPEGGAVPFGYGFVCERVEMFGSEFGLIPFNYLMKAWRWTLRHTKRNAVDIAVSKARAAGYHQGYNRGKTQGYKERDKAYLDFNHKYVMRLYWAKIYEKVAAYDPQWVKTNKTWRSNTRNMMKFASFDNVGLPLALARFDLEAWREITNDLEVVRIETLQKSNLKH